MLKHDGPDAGGPPAPDAVEARALAARAAGCSVVAATLERSVSLVDKAAACSTSPGPETKAALVAVSRARHGHVVIEQAGGVPPPV